MNARRYVATILNMCDLSFFISLIKGWDTLARRPNVPLDTLVTCTDRAHHDGVSTAVFFESVRCLARADEAKHIYSSIPKVKHFSSQTAVSSETRITLNTKNHPWKEGG